MEAQTDGWMFRPQPADARIIIWKPAKACEEHGQRLTFELANLPSGIVQGQKCAIANATRTTIEPAIIMYWNFRAEPCRNRQPITNTPTATARSPI